MRWYLRRFVGVGGDGEKIRLDDGSDELLGLWAGKVDTESFRGGNTNGELGGFINVGFFEYI